MESNQVALELDKLKQRVSAVEAHNGLTDPTAQATEADAKPAAKKAGKKK